MANDEDESATWDDTTLLGWEGRANLAVKGGTYRPTLTAQEAMLVAAFRTKSYARFVASIVGIVFVANVALGIWVGVELSNSSSSSTPSPTYCQQYPALC
jgi:hypothetical protein